MILGKVNADLEATIDLHIRGPGGQMEDVEAAIDTGFNGFLTLSPVLVGQLELSRMGRGRALLASGKEELFNIYEVDVYWDDRWLTVEAIEANTDALLGMALLYGCDLSIEAVVGGRVAIQRRE